MPFVYLSYARGDDVDPFDRPRHALSGCIGISSPAVLKFGLAAIRCRRAG
jgi:hypothetical protein